MGQVIVHFLCRHCGGSSLRLPDHANEQSLVTCASCGVEIGTWGSLRKLRLLARYENERPGTAAAETSTQ